MRPFSQLAQHDPVMMCITLVLGISWLNLSRLWCLPALCSSVGRAVQMRKQALREGKGPGPGHTAWQLYYQSYSRGELEARFLEGGIFDAQDWEGGCMWLGWQTRQRGRAVTTEVSPVTGYLCCVGIGALCYGLSALHTSSRSVALSPRFFWPPFQ